MEDMRAVDVLGDEVIFTHQEVCWWLVWNNKVFVGS